MVSKLTQNFHFSTACTLILTEVYGEKIKMHKHYYYRALAIYELIGLISVLTYVYSLTKLWSIKLSGKNIQNLTYESITILYFLEPLYVITSLYVICVHWIGNTFVHVSLCEWKMSAVSAFSKKHYAFTAQLYFNGCFFFILSI